MAGFRSVLRHLAGGNTGAPGEPEQPQAGFRSVAMRWVGGVSAAAKQAGLRFPFWLRGRLGAPAPVPEPEPEPEVITPPVFFGTAGTPIKKRKRKKKKSFEFVSSGGGLVAGGSAACELDDSRFIQEQNEQILAILLAMD